MQYLPLKLPARFLGVTERRIKVKKIFQISRKPWLNPNPDGRVYYRSPNASQDVHQGQREVRRDHFRRLQQELTGGRHLSTSKSNYFYLKKFNLSNQTRRETVTSSWILKVFWAKFFAISRAFFVRIVHIFYPSFALEGLTDLSFPLIFLLSSY